ncbi:MAG: YDG domain-containing protein [Monoglobaceae bacterium]
MKKRVFAIILALCLSFGFLSTDCGLFPAVHAVTSDICVCGSFAHQDMLGHTSQKSVSWDSSPRWGKRTEYNSDTGKYEEKEYMYSSYIYSFEELNLAYELSKAEAEAKNDPSLVINTYIMACDFTVTKPWIVPEGANITVITQGHDIEVDLTGLQHWYQHYYCAIIVADSCTLTLTSGLGNKATKISGVTHPLDDTTNRTDIERHFSAISVAGADSAVNLYGIEIDMDDTQTCYGIYCEYAGVVNVYDCAYGSGEKKIQTKITGNNYEAVYLRGGALNMYGGLITGNQSHGIHQELYDFSGFGWGKYRNELNIYGGTISDNQGAGIYVSVQPLEAFENLKHTIQLYGGTITGNKQGGIQLHKNSTLALHGEEVDTSIAKSSGTDAVLGPIKITGNTGGNVIAHCDNPGSITVTAGSDSVLREGSTIGVTETALTTYSKDQENVTDGTPESWSFFTSDLSGYVMSFENGKVIQSRYIMPTLQMQDINTTYTGKPVEVSLACVSASCEGEWVWRTKVPTNVTDSGKYWIDFRPYANHYTRVGYQINVTINPKPISVTITPNGGTYGGTITPATATIDDGLLEGDTTTEVILKYYGTSNDNTTSYDYVTTPPTLAGTYTVKAYLNTSNYTFSGTRTAIYKVLRGTQEAPTLIGHNETIQGKNDAYIEGLTTAMQISSDGGKTYSTLKSSTINDPLPPMTYYVRYKGNYNLENSAPTVITLSEGPKMQVTLPESDAQKGYTLTADSTELVWGEELTLSYSLKNGYSETDSFKITVNGSDITASIREQGSYTFVPTDNVTVEVTGVADTIAPDVTLIAKTVSWKQFFNKLTFGLFFKETVDVTVVADDGGSGIDTAEYLVTEKPFTTEQAVKDDTSVWTALTLKNGSATIAVTEQGKKYVYVRVSDVAGNITVVSADGGMVVYTDATANTHSIDYTKTETQDVTAKVNLNGNTVKDIYNGTVLIDSTQYTVSADGTIALKAAYLDTLTAGEYTLHIIYNPCGEQYAEYPADGVNINEEPQITLLKLTVTRQTGTATITGTLDKTYDGTPVSAPQYTCNNTEGIVTVEYKAQGADDSEYKTTAPKTVGKYTVRVTVAEDGNYKAASATADFTISAKEITVAIDGKTSIYGDDIETLTATDNGIVNGDSNVYSLSTIASKTAGVGTYDITGTALDDNYSITFTGGENAYEITKRNLTVTVVVNDKQYDGLNTASIKSVILNNVVNNDSITLLNGTPTFHSVNVANGIGITFTDFTLSGDADVLKNYTLTQPTGVTANITNGWNPVKDTEYTASISNAKGWLKEDLTVTAKDGYELSLTNTADGTWENTLIGAVESADSSLKFYVRNKTTGAVSEQVTVAYMLDKNTETTGTTGKVEFVGRSSWQTFVNHITFGLFYKDEVTVKAEADDGLSGVESIEYAASDKAMSLEEVMAITDWTVMPKDGVGVTVEDEKTFVYFIRITDKAGNVTYISTDGAEYDTTCPAISGIENGSIYHTTQVITVTDKNFESITVNGEPATLDSEGKLALYGNLETTYAIRAMDKAGNVTEYTVTMKVIADITDSIKDITVDDVKSDDKETIETVIKNIKEELKNDDLTDEEKAELEDEKQKAEDLIKKIEEAIGSTETDNTDKVKDITSENVETKDKSDLEKAKDELEKALDDYKDNLTDDEKKDIQDEIDRIEKALEVIDKVEKVEDLINKLPENISKSDADAIKKADEAYKALSKYEQSILDKNAKKKLDNAKSAPEALNNPATGDNGKIWMWFELLFVSGGGLLGTIAYRRKRKETEN